MKVAAVITLTPGSVIRRRISAERSASAAIRRSICAISDSQKSSWRMQPSTVSRSQAGSSTSASQRRPLRPKRSLKEGFAISRRISAAWISFLALVLTRTSWLRRESRRRIAWVPSSGTQTASSEPAATADGRTGRSPPAVASTRRPRSISFHPISILPDDALSVIWPCPVIDPPAACRRIAAMSAVFCLMRADVSSCMS